jgi:3,4-dihydroxy 2-butanone 4-phosphate synthase/GTP cyclohydrolase II
VDILLLAGLSPVAAIAAPVGDDAELLHLPAILALGLPTVTFAELLQSPHPPPAIARVSFKVETVVSTMSRPLAIRRYRDPRTAADHLALFWKTPPAKNALLRVHSECLTRETFGSTKCD